MGKSASVDAEKSMLSKLKQGKQYGLYTLKKCLTGSPQALENH